MKPKRPFAVTLLAFLVLIVAVIYLIRLILALQEWAFLAGMLQFLPVYLALTGLGWGVIGLLLAWGLWRGQSWVPRFARLALLIFSAYYWIDRFIRPGSTGRNSNWLFAVGLNVIILAWVFWRLSRPKVREYFGEIYEHQPQSP